MKTMMSPHALKMMLKTGITQGTLQQCCHREGFSPEKMVQCHEQGLIVCGGCGIATCTNPFHAFARFITIRDGSPFDDTGSKFYYRCEACSNFLCTRCLGIEEDYPCPPNQLERHIFLCPRCRGDVKIYRINHVDMQVVVEQMVQHPSGMLCIEGNSPGGVSI